MPIYEYICKDCDEEFEELVFSQDEQPPCPKCASTNTGKLMSRCCYKNASGGPASGPAATGGGGCAGCSGGSCATCH